MPLPPPGTSIDVQVPPSHELPGIALEVEVEVPWQVVPGPAAHSF